MISAAIFYFGLVSVSWISFVGALTAAQINAINVFLNHTGGDLLGAFREVTKPTLAAYFRESIQNFHTALDPYLNGLDDTVRKGVNPAPPPDSDSDLSRELAGLTNLVNLIKYENLTLLQELKWILSTYGQHGHLGPESTLGMIDDEYVIAVWNEYVASRTGQRHPLTTYIHLATLYSMNRTMLSLASHPLLVSLVMRLADYHDMIIRLHASMARYLQIDTLCPFSKTFRVAENQLNELAMSVDIPDTINQIRTLAYDLSTQILLVIAIYGCPPGPEFPFLHGDRAIAGTEIIFKLFVTRWDIRRLIGQQIGRYVSFEDWILCVLNSLYTELLKIQDSYWIWNHLYGPTSAWVLRLWRMVNKALYVLDPPVPGSAGPAGTN
jgi:hypothetical protein